MINDIVLDRVVSRNVWRRNLVTPVSNKVDSVAISTYQYSYDELNRATSRNDDNFGYNARSEVISADSATNTFRYAFDNIGNNLWTSINFATNTYTANNLNQYTSILRAPAPPREPTYDLDGNMVSNGIWSYTWDAENRLTAAFSNSVCVVSNAYDHASRRVLKVTLAATHTFLYDGWNLVQETIATASGVTTNTYIWGKDLSGTLQGAGGVGGLLAVSIDGAWYFPFSDANGNITAYVNENGSIVAEYTYGAFGETIAQSGSMADTFRFRFSTKYYDSETGLFYYGYRFYSSSLMRWLSRDPIGEEGGDNVYAFIGNQVLAHVDPYGLQQQNTSCAGTCGAIIDDWVLAEINAQFNGWDVWKKNNSTDWLGRPKAIVIEDYLKWANGNQRYKDPHFFEFNKGVYPKCGTENPSKSSVGCGRSVTLCGQCVRSAILGNIMYGLVGRHAGFTAQELRDGATNTKRKWGLRVDNYDEAAYDVGSSAFDKKKTGITIQDFCSEFNELVQSTPDALREGNSSGGYNNLTTCQTCSEKSKESRHGGSESSRRRP